MFGFGSIVCMSFFSKKKEIIPETKVPPITMRTRDEKGTIVYSLFRYHIANTATITIIGMTNINRFN